MANIEPSESNELCSSIFRRAVLRYIDEKKPDPLTRQQLSNLYFGWKHFRKRNDDVSSGSDGDKSQNSATIDGCLSIYGSYIVVFLHVCCQWECGRTIEPVDRRISTAQIHLCMWVEARFLSTEEKIKYQIGNEIEGMNQKERRAAAKMEAKVINRIQTDPYIRRILKKEILSYTNDKSENLLCEVFIQRTANEVEVIVEKDTSSTGKTTKPDISNLEEKVFVSSDLLEALKRSLFSQFDSNISVMDFLLEMPYVPKKMELSKSLVGNKSERSLHCPFKENDLTEMVSRRVHLRVLEDVAIDECEKEGENDLLSDLSLTDRTDSDDEIAEKFEIVKAKRRK